MTDKTLFQIFPDADPGWLELFHNAAVNEKPIQFEKFSPILNKWLSFRVFCPEKGKLAGLFFDVTERKRVEAALQEARLDFERAQEVGKIGWWRLDLQRNVLTWSDENHRINAQPKRGH